MQTLVLINLEDGTILPIKGGSGVVIIGRNGGTGCSPNNDYAFIEKPSTSRAPSESVNSESVTSKQVPPVNLITGNFILYKKVKNSNLNNNQDLSDFYLELQ